MRRLHVKVNRVIVFSYRHGLPLLACHIAALQRRLQRQITFCHFWVYRGYRSQRVNDLQSVRQFLADHAPMAEIIELNQQSKVTVELAAKVFTT